MTPVQRYLIELARRPGGLVQALTQRGAARYLRTVYVLNLADVSYAAIYAHIRRVDKKLTKPATA